jgi:hypothetical protein
MSRPYESDESDQWNDRGSNGERRVGEALSTTWSGASGTNETLKGFGVGGGVGTP